MSLLVLHTKQHGWPELAGRGLFTFILVVVYIVFNTIPNAFATTTTVAKTGAHIVDTKNTANLNNVTKILQQQQPSKQQYSYSSNETEMNNNNITAQRSSYNEHARDRDREQTHTVSSRRKKSPPLLAESSSANYRQTARNSRQRERERKPNIVLILTDDQDVELGSLNFMPRMLRILRDGGAEFRHAYSTTPMCCPARSSLLTGMYVHNHMVFTNNDNCSSPQWQATHETRSFATYLSNAGYRTGYFGKYLNKYNGSYIPPGWREWGGLIMNSKYYNYSVNMNGQKIKHGFDYAKDYYPDLIANDSIAFLRSSKQQNQRKPVLLVMSFPAPHGPEDSAPQYSHLFFNVTTHHTPAYDHAPNLDKQWILRVTQKMEPVHKRFTDLLMTKRLQTLQSVDIAVERIYNELKALGELDNTYIVYTSDHGYHLGQFGLIKGKSFPFEFDVRVPFFMRGPGIQQQHIVNGIALNVDLAPTFLDLAGVTVPPHMDGRSILPLVFNKVQYWPDTFLIESSGRRETAEQLAESRARLRLEEQNSLLVNSTILEKIDNDVPNMTKKLQKQFFETSIAQNVNDSSLNVALNMKSEDDDEHAHRIGALHQHTPAALDFDEYDEYVHGVDSDDLNEMFDNKLPLTPYVTKMMRLNSECSDPKLQINCLPGQKWRCVNENGRWRKHKCKFHLHQYAVHHQPSASSTCACFTADGVIYTKSKENAHDETRANRKRFLNFGKQRSSKSKREITQLSMNETYHTELPYDMEELLDVNNVISFVEHDLTHKINVNRKKRELLRTYDDAESMNHLSNSNVSKILQEIQDTLVSLELKYVEENAPKNKSLTKISNAGFVRSSKFPKVGGRVGTQCYIDGHTGKVNCSDVIYDDEKMWRKSRTQIDVLIRVLKDKITQLKYLKKQIRDNKQQRIHGHGHAAILRRNDTTRHSANNNSFHRKFGQSFPMEEADEFTKEDNLVLLGHPTTPQLHVVSSNITTKKNLAENNAECYCEPGYDFDYQKEFEREFRRKQKADRLRKKARKRLRKARIEKECLAEKMNCFSHDNSHWRTAPLWTDGPFCFCMNANNNTYSCARTINATHNYLYCEFTTGLITFYDLSIDPYETLNRAASLTTLERSFMHDTLEQLKSCTGRSCTLSWQDHVVVPTNATLSIVNDFSGNKQRQEPLNNSAAFDLPMVKRRKLNKFERWLINSPYNRKPWRQPHHQQQHHRYFRQEHRNSWRKKELNLRRNRF